MPIKRRISKVRSGRITPEAVAAFKAGDYRGLHRALGLKPWEMSPLPQAVHGLGCDPDNPPPEANHTLFAASWPKAAELQRELIEAAKEA